MRARMFHALRYFPQIASSIASSGVAAEYVAIKNCSSSIMEFMIRLIRRAHSNLYLVAHLDGHIDMQLMISISSHGLA